MKTFWKVFYEKSIANQLETVWDWSFPWNKFSPYIDLSPADKREMLVSIPSLWVMKSRQLVSSKLCDDHTKNYEWTHWMTGNHLPFITTLPCLWSYETFLGSLFAKHSIWYFCFGCVTNMWFEYSTPLFFVGELILL